MTSIAARVLEEAARAESQAASVTVEKPLALELDLGNMLALDNNQIDPKQLDTKEKLLSLARDNTQLLLNAIWDLETVKVEDAVTAKFPPPSYVLPREKPAPKPKVMTKWEKYAKEKGIDKKKKKDRLVWDDVVQKWVPQFGYKKAQAEADKNWAIPVKHNADPNENPYEKLAEDKREKVAKNELQRLRNLARSKNITVPSVGVAPVSKSSKALAKSDDLKNAAEIAKSSTASLGKFQENLNKKLESSSKVKGKKRKFESNTVDNATEQKRSLNILESITNKSARINIDAAVNKQIYREDQERKTEKEKEREGKGKSKGKGKRNKAHFARKGGKGKFTGHKAPNRGSKGVKGKKG